MKIHESIFIVSSVIALLLCSCTKQSDTNSSNSTSQAVIASSQVPSQTSGSIESPESSDSETSNILKSNEESDICPDLRVVASFVYSGDTYAVVENIGEQAILNFRIAYINFDNNGFATTSDNYEGGRAETVNLMPGDKDICAWYGASGNYAVATISEVDYADGRSWKMQNIDRWAKNIRNTFNVDEEKAKLDNLKTVAGLAEIPETNEFATLVDISFSHENRFSSDADLKFTIQNISDQGIVRLSVFVLEFDENGFPVSVNPYDTYCKNGHAASGTVNLAAGQSNSYTSSLFISGETTEIKAVIMDIEFQDGTEWQNPYIYEWIIANNNTY